MQKESDSNPDNDNDNNPANNSGSRIGNKSLVAFLGAIRFLRGKRHQNVVTVERGFAQPHPRARQLRTLAEESYYCVRSAN